MIICLGDSHSSVFSQKERIISQWPIKEYRLFSRFKPVRIGPATAYNLGTKVELLNNILNKTFYRKNDYVLFCFGEVDIRAHLIKQSKIQNAKIETLVVNCVDRYVAAMKSVNPNRKLNKAVFAPIASWSENKPYDGPSYGTNLERNKTTRLFNDYLEKTCIENNIKFISIFDELLNEDGTTDSNYLDDFGSGIHLNQKSMPLILNKLKTNNLI